MVPATTNISDLWTWAIQNFLSQELIENILKTFFSCHLHKIERRATQGHNVPNNFVAFARKEKFL